MTNYPPCYDLDNEWDAIEYEASQNKRKIASELVDVIETCLGEYLNKNHPAGFDIGDDYGHLGNTAAHAALAIVDHLPDRGLAQFALAMGIVDAPEELPIP